MNHVICQNNVADEEIIIHLIKRGSDTWEFNDLLIKNLIDKCNSSKFQLFKNSELSKISFYMNRQKQVFKELFLNISYEKTRLHTKIFDKNHRYYGYTKHVSWHYDLENFLYDIKQLIIKMPKRYQKRFVFKEVLVIANGVKLYQLIIPSQIISFSKQKNSYEQKAILFLEKLFSSSGEPFDKFIDSWIKKLLTNKERVVLKD